MGTFTSKLRSFLKSEEAAKIVVPTYYAEAPVFPKTIRGVQTFPNYSTKLESAGMTKLYFKGLAKDEDEFIKNFVFKSQMPWYKNPMAILDPTRPEEVVRTYVKMEDARWSSINNEIRQMMKEAYGLHISDPAAKKLWIKENAGLYKKLMFSFKGTFELKKENDGALAYVGTVEEVLNFEVVKDTREEPVFRSHPMAVVDPTEGQAAWFERYRIHPNKDVNLDVLEAAKKASLEMGITDMTIEGF